MILGQTVPQNDRIPFQRPAAAGFYTPGIPQTRYNSNIQPFPRIFNPLVAANPRGINYPAGMAPGRIIREGLSAPVAPDGAAPTAQVQASSPNAKARSIARAISPYQVMKSGMIPGVYAGGRNGIRQGVTSAADLIRRMTPGQYKNNTPAGNWNVR